MINKIVVRMMMIVMFISRPKKKDWDVHYVMDPVNFA